MKNKTVGILVWVLFVEIAIVVAVGIAKFLGYLE